MNEKQILIKAMKVFEEMDENRLFNDGGYPSVIDDETFPEHIVIATLDHKGAPDLIVWEKNKIVNAVLDGMPYSNEWTLFDCLAEAGFCL